MARTRDQVLASARAFMADCKPLQYDCEPGVFVNGRRRHLDQDDDPEDGRDYPSAEGSQQYATERAKAGLPVEMNLGKITNIPGQSYLPVADLRWSSELATSVSDGGLRSGFPGSRPVPRTLQEQKDLVKLVAKGELKDVYPSGDNPVRGNGFGEMKRGGMNTFDPPAMAVAADRLQDRGHMLAAKIARWRASVEDPKNFGHLWTKEHAEEHAAGYASKPGGVQQYGLRDSLKKAARTAAAGAAIAGGGAAGMNAGNLVLPTATWMGHPIAVAAGKGPQFVDRSIDTLEKMQQMHESSPAFVQKTAKVITKPVSSMEDTVDMFRLGTGMPVSQLHTPHNFGPIMAGGAAGAGLAAGLLARRRSKKSEGYSANPGGVQSYATDAAEAGKPVRMNLEKIRGLPGQSYLPSLDLLHSATVPEIMERELVRERGVIGVRPVPKTLQQQKDLVKLVAKGELKDVYPSGKIPIADTGFGELEGGFFNFDPPAMAVAADRLQERGHTLAAKIARWRASVEDPENFGHLWTKEHAEEHAAGYAASGDAIAGGVADNRDADEFDREDVAEGSREEMEHTRDPGIAQEIARDHLAEDPEYYRKLRKAGLTEYATVRAKAGLPVKMNLHKIRGLPGQSYLPSFDLSFAASLSRRGGAKKGFSGTIPVPRTLQEQKDLVKLVAKGGLKDVYPAGDNPESEAGFGEMRRGTMRTFDPSAIAVAADRLQDRGHMLAAKIARWRAATGDPENFGHLWTKEHQDEHAAGYAAKSGGVQSYATERAKAGLPVRMKLNKIRSLPGQSYLPASELRWASEYAPVVDPVGFKGKPYPRTLQEQKDLVKLVAKGGLKDVYPSSGRPISTAGFGETPDFSFDPPAMAVAADRLADRGHTLAAKLARWRASVEDPENFGHLWTKEHAAEHAAGYAASMSENQRDGMSVQYAADLVCGM